MLEKLYIIFWGKKLPKNLHISSFFCNFAPDFKSEISGKRRVKSMHKLAWQQILTCCNTGS